MARSMLNKRMELRPGIWQDKAAATHFLCLPLWNSNSEAKLDKMFAVFKDTADLCDVPRTAFRLPRSYHIQVSSYRIETAASLETALRTFYELDTSALLNLPDLHQSSNLRKNIAALQLKLKGLSPTFGIRMKPHGILTCVDDPSNRLASLLRCVHEHVSSGATLQPIYQIRSTKNPLLPLLGPLLLDMRKIRKRAPGSQVRMTPNLYDQVSQGVIKK